MKSGISIPNLNTMLAVSGSSLTLGRKSNKILKIAIESLVRMNHRGASGAEEATGDGEEF